MENQYYPFDDFLNLTIFDYGPDGEELPWREVAKQMRKIPREKNSEMLAHLTRVFRNELENIGETKALEKFWQEVEKMRNEGFLTDDMEKELLDAKAENIKAAQVMVRANPYVIHLPFVARAMRSVLYQHKYCDSKKIKDSELHILSEVKGLWNDFLPKRTGGDITYSHADLKRLVLLAEKQIRREGFNKIDAREAVAEALNVSIEYLKRNIKIKAKRGRPKKVRQ